MRYEKFEDLLHLALEMQARHGGVSLEDLQERFSVGRRTALRMKDRVMRVFPQVDEMTADIEALDERAVAGLAELTKLQETVWAAPLLFYSDGTSRTASFDIVDEKLRSRRLSVRALTGGVTISDPNQEVRR